MPVTEKRCPSCGETKPADAFSRRSGKRRHQLQSWCRTCTSGYGGDGWAAVKVPARLRDVIRVEAARNDMGIGQFLVRAVQQAVRQQCAAPGCLAPRMAAPHGLCRRHLAEADARADSRRLP